MKVRKLVSAGAVAGLLMVAVPLAAASSTMMETNGQALLAESHHLKAAKPHKQARDLRITLSDSLR